ncbi:hypothetical protein MWN34_09690 [Ancylobacter sp. 6x-1]|uniref:DUF4148 domain-containing protein n=1 Tax=Ancylobacter crimeensis TaxID=2579147 RepID=A0ABT0DBA7_9HYPH|nr:hypothetical protein [Ancylobacter crimeensis]MCK0197184.1 hypothetical protein [Ancylobacter crimeensis]
MKRHLITALAAAVALSVAVPAAYAQSPELKKFGTSNRNAQLKTHEQIRKEQVRKNAHRPVYEPLTHNLYKGKNSPGQKLKRAVTN